ncbi:MAG: hypothetical protein KAZ30_03585 [Candidatus Magasanikbacteria bacterium]|nr:hypothetical protein [Candidatus Magasanikbacteria bacterium]
MSVETLSEEPQAQLETPELQIEQEKREVARVFVLQSNNPDSIRTDLEKMMASGKMGLSEAVTKLSLTHCLWIEKNKKSRNSGQVMPIGGGKSPEDGGDLGKTVTRELLYETHLRPTEIAPLLDYQNEPIVIDYKMRLKDPEKPIKEVENSQTLYIAKILPSDIPYQLEPEEDKIARFHKLTVEDMGTLWGANTLDKDGEVQLYDSLRLYPKDSESERIDLKFKEPVEHATLVAETMRSLGNEARGFEADKMYDVAHELVETARWKNPDMDYGEIGLLQNKLFRLKELRDDLPKAKEIYFEIIDLCSNVIDLMEWFPHAVERSNFKEELRNPGNSDIEAAIRFAFLLSETNLSLEEVVLLKHELDMESGPPRPVNGYYDMINFLAKIACPGGKAISKDEKGKEVVLLTDERVTEYANSKKQSIIEDEVSENTGIANISDKLERINKFIKNMIASGVNQDRQDKLDVDELDPMSNTAAAKIKGLLKLGFEDLNDEEHEIFKAFESEEIRKRIKFEALRKLFFLSALEPASRRYSEVIKLGNSEIEDIWNKVVSVRGSTERSLTIIDENGEAKQRFMRTLNVDTGLLVTPDVRTKQVDNYFRKIITRGFDNPEDLWDTYGRSLVLAPDPNAGFEKSKELFTRQSFEVETYYLDYNKNFVKQTQTVFEYPAVIKIIQGLQAKGVKIVDYDPTNLPGTPFNSSGPGGGDPIVMAKFYMCLDTEEDGEVERRFEEVQIFSPTEDGISGFKHKENKAYFDAKRKVRRLKDTKGLRSFIELLSPAGVYGDPVHAAHRKGAMKR